MEELEHIRSGNETKVDQDSMRLACANAVLAVYCNYLLEVPKQKTCMNCM